MKFVAQPHLLVHFAKPVKNIKHIRFDEKGEFETSDEALIKKLSPHFEAHHQVDAFACKKCNFTTSKKGQLLYHYRSHKEVSHESSYD